MILRLAWKTFGIAMAVLVALTPVISRAQESHAPHWSYEGREDPEHWGSLDPAFATCKVGHNQSPIDILNPKLADLPELKIDYKAVPLSIINNGHTIMVNYAPGSTLTVGDKTYSLKQFHFHHPSEEHINGTGFDMGKRSPCNSTTSEFSTNACRQTASRTSSNEDFIPERSTPGESDSVPTPGNVRARGNRVQFPNQTAE